MVGRPRLSNEEVMTVSPTRTYIVGIHDLVCPNEIRWEKFVLPESFPNNSGAAKYYYLSQCEDRAIRVDVCIAYEDYKGLVNDIVDDVILEQPKEKKIRHFDTRSTSLAEDMKDVRVMLDGWNDEQKHPNTCYCMILRSILHKMAFQDKFIADLKKELLNL